MLVLDRDLVLLEVAGGVGEERARLPDPAAAHEAKKIFADRSNVEIVASAPAALEGADALVVITEWQEFRSPDFAAIKEKLKSPAIFDGRNLYDPAALKAQGIAYEKVDISLDSQARDYVMALGYLQAPVVVAGSDHWSGFRPDRIRALTGAVAVTA